MDFNLLNIIDLNTTSSRTLICENKNWEITAYFSKIVDRTDIRDIVCCSTAVINYTGGRNPATLFELCTVQILKSPDEEVKIAMRNILSRYNIVVDTISIQRYIPNDGFGVLAIENRETALDLFQSADLYNDDILFLACDCLQTWKCENCKACEQIRYAIKKSGKLYANEHYSYCKKNKNC